MKKKTFAPTPEQISAITTENKTLLVSAAAGSGKTDTLTKRIIHSLTRDGNREDISRMLIVTFTNTAVSELQERIKAALEGAIQKAREENPDSEDCASLEHQLNLLPMAKICTIDSYCNEILRKNSDKVGIPPNYRIADTAEVEILSYSILSGLIDSLYENERCDIMTADEFSRLADTVTSSKKNSKLEEILLKLYEKSKSAVEGTAVFQHLAEKYCKSDYKNNEYTQYAVKLLHSAAKHASTRMEKLADELSLSGGDGEIKYSEVFYNDSERIRSLTEIKSYFHMKSALDSLKYATLPRKAEKTELMISARPVRDSLKTEISSLKNKYFFYSEDEMKELFSNLGRELSSLAKLITEFDKIYMAEKLHRHVLEYSDIERFAYAALYNEDKTLTDFAYALKNEYSSVYIDEYQDVNELQAEIFNAISRPDNRFMVGDIKQSIYGFRSARPDIFAKMKETFPSLSESGLSPQASIFMSKNFRSDEGIIDFANSVFDKVFGITRESIDYVDDDRLIFGKVYDEEKPLPEYKKPSFILIPSISKKDDGDFSNEEDDDEEGSKRRLFECKVVAEKISSILKSGKLNSGERVRPSDIAIIIRQNKERVNNYYEALSALNIPSEKAEDTSFFLNSDVLLALCLLNTIDNPEKDIYLAGLLASPLYSFTADELYKIRHMSYGSLYKSLGAFCAENPDFKKGNDFLRQLDFYRTLSEGMPIDSFILRLYNDTGLIELAKKQGSAENLLLLYNYAKTFSASSLKGLYNFIKFINNIIERGTKFDSQRDGDAKDAVHIVTAHKSKGLQYPIVFYVDTDAMFRNKDNSDKIIFAENFGISMRLRTEGGLALVESPIHNVIMKKNTQKYYEEEFRIIYVALTRAAEQLFVVGCIDEDSDAYLESIENKSAFLDEYSIYKTKSALELMLLTKPDADVIVTNKMSDIEERETAGEPANINTASQADVFALSAAELRARVDFSYSEKHLTKIPQKLSVSKLSPTILDGTEEEKTALLIEECEKKKARLEKRRTVPDFISGTEHDESAKRGIATHSYLQFFNIELFDRNGASHELERLVAEGFISNENKDRVRLDEIELFRKSDFFSEMKNAKKIYRELRFNTRLPAKYFTENKELKASLSDEELLVQGVIDCIIEDGAGDLHLVDYKTDRLTENELNTKSLAAYALNKAHARQLNYYSMATEKIFGKKPKTLRVYSLHLGDTVDIKKTSFENS